MCSPVLTAVVAAANPVAFASVVGTSLGVSKTIKTAGEFINFDNKSMRKLGREATGQGINAGFVGAGKLRQFGGEITLFAGSGKKTAKGISDFGTPKVPSIKDSVTPNVSNSNSNSSNVSLSQTISFGSDKVETKDIMKDMKNVFENTFRQQNLSAVK